jgi:hypothetical protein
MLACVQHGGQVGECMGGWVFPPMQAEYLVESLQQSTCTKPPTAERRQ